MQKSLINGAYVYMGKRKQYGIIRSKRSESVLLLKVKNGAVSGNPELGGNQPIFEEIEVDIMEEDIRVEVEVLLRVIVSEDNRFTLTLKRPSNDKIKVLAEDLGEMLGLSKYALTFFYHGDKVGLNERLGDREIGCKVGEGQKQP